MDIKVGDSVFLKAYNNYLGVVVRVAIDVHAVKSYDVEWNDGTGSVEGEKDICEFRQKYLDLLGK